MPLAQMSYRCPGLHGPGTNQDISRQTFAQVLEKYPKLIIPLFQRRYCWTEIQFENWWNDVHHGERDHLVGHNCGKMRVKPNQNGELIVIDGQQRLTTTMIFLAALQNCMSDKNKVSKYIMNGKNYRLIPSYLDRPAFYSILDNVENKNHLDDNFENRKDDLSHQWKAYEYFERKNKQLNNEEIDILFHNALHKMSVIIVIIVNEVNLGQIRDLEDWESLGQIYLWFQEKSLFGMGALLQSQYGPGEFMTGADLVRNLVLTAVANEDLKDQEQFYYQYWLKPLEEKVSIDLTDFIYRYVQQFDFEHQSKTENFANQYLKNKPEARISIMAYARFYSLYEWRLKTANPTIELSNNIDTELVLKVTKEILTEMATDLSKEVS